MAAKKDTPAPATAPATEPATEVMAPSTEPTLAEVLAQIKALATRVESVANTVLDVQEHASSLGQHLDDLSQKIGTGTLGHAPTEHAPTESSRRTRPVLGNGPPTKKSRMPQVGVTGRGTPVGERTAGFPLLKRPHAPKDSKPAPTAPLVRRPGWTAGNPE